MKNNKGFTLLELLVAATIIGTLAVFATVSYKNSAADARMESFKARADELAGAVQRFSFEYPTKDGELIGEMSASSPLVSGGFVGKGGWEKTYVTYYICNGKTGNCVNSLVDNPLVCVASNSNSWTKKLPSRYQAGYIYCVSAIAKGERLGS